MTGHARTKARYAWHGLVCTLVAGTATIFVRESFCDVTEINGKSMAPTLSPNVTSTGAKDVVFWRKHLPTRNLHRGDVVLFCAPHNPEGISTKRVVALAGDTVRLDPRRRPADSQNGRTSASGRRWDMMYAQNGGKVEVPQGHVWVEGDNWRHTLDSNTYGPISRSLIIGKAVSIVRPFRQFGQTPWKGWVSRTKVIEGQEVIDDDASSWEPV